MATQIKGKSFQVSDTGLIALRLRYFCDTEDDAIFGVPASYRGLIRRGHNGAEWDAEEDKWIVDVTYQGLVSGDPSQDLDQYEIQGEFREEPVESFPDRAALIASHGAYIEEGRLKFPETMPAKTGSGFTSGKATSEQNPLFGLTSYPVYYEQASHTYVRTHVSASVHNKVGTVIANLPSGFEYDGPAKAWFVDAPQLRKTGNAWTITERYKEMDAMKHINALYSLIKK